MKKVNKCDSRLRRQCCHTFSADAHGLRALQRSASRIVQYHVNGLASISTDEREKKCLHFLLGVKLTFGCDCSKSFDIRSCMIPYDALIDWQMPEIVAENVRNPTRDEHISAVHSNRLVARATAEIHLRSADGEIARHSELEFSFLVHRHSSHRRLLSLPFHGSRRMLDAKYFHCPK